MKNTFRILFAVILAMTICVFASALTLDTAECATETNVRTEATLAVASTTIPGVNLFTENEKVYTFSESGASPEAVAKSPDNIQMWWIADPGYDDGRCLATLNNGSAGTGVQFQRFTLNVPVEAGRKYYVAGVTKGKNGSKGNPDFTDYILWVLQDGQDISGAFRYDSAKVGEWQPFEFNFTAKSSSSFLFQNNTHYQNLVYFDNLTVVPYYKVTYIGLDGVTEVATDYVLLDDNGDFLTSYTPDLTKVPGATGFALTAGGESVTSVALNKADIKLYAKAPDVIPGKNLLTGNENVYTFNEAGAGPEAVAKSQSNLSVWWLAGNGYDDGRSLGTTTNGTGEQYQSITLKASVKAGRKYYVAGATKAQSGYNDYILWLLQGGTQLDLFRYSNEKVENGEWELFRLDCTTTSDNNLVLQNKSYGGKTIMFDNLTVVPYYKVTYMGLDGVTVAATDYVLLDDNGDFLTRFTPDLTKVAGATDFALTAGGEIVDSVELGNQDIVLYSIKRDKVYFTDGNTTVPVVLDEDTYTIPTAGELGMVSENFIAWTDGEKTFNVGESYSTADLNTKTLSALYLDTTKYKAPEMMNVTEIKGTGENNGIRFKSSIKPSVKANLDEFGFLATREVLLPYTDDTNTTRDHSALTFLYKATGTNTNLFVKGIAYDADGDIDVINGAATDGSIIYTAVVSGIPLANKEETMVIRPYAKFDINGKEMTVYGDAAAASLYETALEIKNEDGEAYKNNKTYIDSILAE